MDNKGGKTRRSFLILSITDSSDGEKRRLCDDIKRGG